MFKIDLEVKASKVNALTTELRFIDKLVHFIQHCPFVAVADQLVN